MAQSVSISKISKNENRSGYLFISPWLIGFFLFLVGPGLYSLYMSFNEWDLFSPPEYVGIQNYIELFTDDPTFIKSLSNTLLFVIRSVLASMIIALGLALLMNTNSRIMYLFRTIFYVPSVVSGVAVAILWSWIFAPDFGILNYVLSGLGITGIDWLGNPRYAPWAFVIIMTTSFIGAPMIIFIAGLQNIPKEQYESASIDGANAWSKLRFITLPELAPIILYNAITMLIGAFRVFAQAVTLAGKDGYPSKSLLFYVMYLYKKGFTQMQMGKASAMAWIFFVLIFSITALIIKLGAYKDAE